MKASFLVEMATDRAMPTTDNDEPLRTNSRNRMHARDRWCVVVVVGLMMLVLEACGRCGWADECVVVAGGLMMLVLEVCGRRGWADDVGTGGVWSSRVG